MSDTTTPDSAHQPAPISHNQPSGEKIRSPHHIPTQTVTALVHQWSDITLRTFITEHTTDQDPNPDDLYATLAYSARIADEVTAGRWCIVADLLRAGAIESWTQIGIAMGITDTQARDGFRDWITGQVNLRCRYGDIGFTTTQASDLTTLAQAVPR